jgi:pimeloyl-ACP methyl ester carboxylesterase
MAAESVDYCRDGRVEYVENATHWVIHEEPDRVTDALLEALPESW